MSRFDPDFQFFQRAVGYRNCHTDHEMKLRSFREYVCHGTKLSDGVTEEFVIQFVCHPNFAAHLKTITYYTFDPSSGTFDETGSLPTGYRRANSFKNYKCPQHNLFFEVNLYKAGVVVSSHHISTKAGREFSRIASAIDIGEGPDHSKGPHWVTG